MPLPSFAAGTTTETIRWGTLCGLAGEARGLSPVGLGGIRERYAIAEVVPGCAELMS
jgi:hypothetical protein